VRRLFAFAIFLAACQGRDRAAPPADTRAASATPVNRGPDALLLRVPRDGGVPRVVGYPNVDSSLWTGSDAAPALERVLAFDADAGLFAAIDTRGRPVWLDLRIGSVTVPTRDKLTGLVSVDGSTIYGIGSDGAVARFTPTGNWVFKPPRPARAVFPQTNGTLLVFGGRGDNGRVWRIHPPDPRISDSVAIGDARGGVGAPLGDLVFFTRPPRSLISLSARTLALGALIKLDEPPRVIAISPSGDRSYVISDSANAVFVVDRYQQRVTARAELPGRPRDLRVDPFGRYLLIRAAAGDSVWVMSVGTDRVVETVQSKWRGDLPLVAIDGSLLLAQGGDVIIHGPRQDRRIADGAADFWHPFVWNGLRPRAAALDEPVTFPSDSDTTAFVAPPAVAAESAATPPTPRTDSAAAGFTVSFAVLLDEARARDQASRITVNGQHARVIADMSNGTALYRVVLGPFPTRQDADRAGRASGLSYLVYAGAP
jgi:hypothetical protein